MNWANTDFFQKIAEHSDRCLATCAGIRHLSTNCSMLKGD